MKKMLITGASRGIGKACAEYFKAKYEIITVARTGDVTIKGDLTNKMFLKELVDTVDADVLINNAGLLSHDFEETFQLNVMSACYLTAQFYSKMNSGNIINLCSTASHMRGWKGMPQERVWYLASKSSLMNLGVVLQNSRNSNVKVTNLEPGWVNTQFAGEEIQLTEDVYQSNKLNVLPMKPYDIAKTIEWILDQPTHIVINTLQLDNFHPKT